MPPKHFYFKVKNFYPSLHGVGVGEEESRGVLPFLRLGIPFAAFLMFFS